MKYLCATLNLLLIFACIKSYADIETTLPPVTVTAIKSVSDCFREAEIEAKQFSDLKAREVEAQLEKNSLITGAATGIGCLALSAIVLGLDGGSLALGCMAVGTITGAASYSDNRKVTTNRAMDEAKNAFKEYKLRKYEECAEKYR